MFMTNEVKGSDKKKSVTCKLKLRDKSSVLRRKVSEVSSREFQEREIQRGPRKNIIFSKISMINVLFERPLRIRQHFKHRLTRSPNIWTEFLDDVRMDEPEGVTLTDLLRRHIDSLMIIARKKRRGDQTNTKHWKLRGPCVIPMGQQAGQHLWLLLSRLAAGDRVTEEPGLTRHGPVCPASAELEQVTTTRQLPRDLGPGPIIQWRVNSGDKISCQTKKQLGYKLRWILSNFVVEARWMINCSTLSRRRIYKINQLLTELLLFSRGVWRWRDYDKKE